MCLDFVVNGKWCQHNCRIPIVWHPKFFHIILLPIFKISFVCKLKRLKILKDPFKEVSPIVAPEIGHISSFL